MRADPVRSGQVGSGQGLALDLLYKKISRKPSTRRKCDDRKCPSQLYLHNVIRMQRCQAEDVSIIVVDGLIRRLRHASARKILRSVLR